MPKLIIRKGDKVGTEYPLPKESRILGRSKRADIQVPGAKVSRKHAEVYFDDGVYRLRDLNSSNGTLVNGRRLQEEIAISSGDRIQIGHTLLEFFDENAPPPVLAEAAAEPPPVPGEPTAVDIKQSEVPSPGVIDPGRPDYGLILLGVVALLVVLLGGFLTYIVVRSAKGDKDNGTKVEQQESPGAESTAPTGGE
jgi:hypothetical protein